MTSDRSSAPDAAPTRTRYGPALAWTAGGWAAVATAAAALHADAPEWLRALTQGAAIAISLGGGAWLGRVTAEARGARATGPVGAALLLGTALAAPEAPLAAGGWAALTGALGATAAATWAATGWVPSNEGERGRMAEAGRPTGREPGARRRWYRRMATVGGAGALATGVATALTLTHDWTIPAGVVLGLGAFTTFMLAVIAAERAEWELGYDASPAWWSRDGRDSERTETAK